MPTIYDVDPVGISEIADRLNAKHNTVKSWRKKRVLPEERWIVSGSPVWDWRWDIIPWAREYLDPEHYSIP